MPLKSPKQLTWLPETVLVTLGHRPEASEFTFGVKHGWEGSAAKNTVRPTKCHSPWRTTVKKASGETKKRLEAVMSIATEINKKGGRALLVGGAVRDMLLGYDDCKDLDIEVFGIEEQDLREIISSQWKVNEVGALFSVLKVKGLEIDVALPRKERKSGRGHRGFETWTDSQMSVQQAAARRDFTINAISVDPLTGELIDPVGGVADLEGKVLRHVSEKFAEDPLRVLRAARFVSRFDLVVAQETVALCQELYKEMDALPQERIWGEIKRILTESERPGNALHFLKACGWQDVFPGLAELKQETLWDETAHALDAIASCSSSMLREDLLACGLAALVAQTAAIKGEAACRVSLEELTLQKKGVHQAAELALACSVVTSLEAADVTDEFVRKLALQVNRIDLLDVVARAVNFENTPICEIILEKARRLGVEKNPPRPLVGGKDLLALGVSSGPQVGKLVRSLFQLQLEGQISSFEEGMVCAKKLLESATTPVTSKFT